MPYHETSLWRQPLQLLRDHLNTQYAVMHKEDLPSPVDLAQNHLAYQAFVILPYGRAYGQPLLRRRLYNAHIARSEERHMQRAWNGRRGHRQHIDFTAQL